MATVNKDFKIKSGLIVEGTTATVNGYDILTKKQGDQDYIVGLIGGTSTSANTPDTVVKRDGFGNFAAGQIDLDSKLTTPDVRIADAGKIFVDGQDLAITTYDNNDLLLNAQNNVIVTTQNANIDLRPDGQASVHGDQIVTVSSNQTLTNKELVNPLINGEIKLEDSNGNFEALISLQSDELVLDTDSRNIILSPEGGNVYVQNSNTSDNIVVTEGYLNDTISNLDLSATYDAKGSAATAESNAKSYTDSKISTEVSDRNSAISTAITNLNLSGTYDALGAADNVQTNLDNHISDTSAHGVTGNVVGTTDAQSLSNKTFQGQTNFQSAGGAGGSNNHIDVNGNTGDLVVTSGYGLDITAQGDIAVTSNGGNIVLNPDGNAYVGSASAGNEIATNGYVDNAVAGLNWKQAVNLLSKSNVNLNADAPSIDGNTLSNGYRVLLTGQANDAENGIYEYASISKRLTRTADADTYEELVGSAVFVMEGDQYGQTSWVQSNHYLSSFTGQSWTQFSGTGSVVAGTGITVDGLTVSVDRTTVDAWYDYNGAAADAESAANTYTDQGLATKQDTLIAGDGIYIDSSNNITGRQQSGGGLKFVGAEAAIDRSTVDNWYDASGAAASAQSNAESYADNAAEQAQYAAQSYADSLASNYDAAGAANTAMRQAEDYTDTQINALTTTDIEEGTNEYFTDSRAKSSAADLLTGANLTNITITGTGAGLTITAENGVADSTTDDLQEGQNNLYFTQDRVLQAIGNQPITPQSVTIDTFRKEEATQQYLNTASTTDVHSMGYPYESAKYLVRVVGWVNGTKHSQVSEILMTVDGNDNIAITEYGTICTDVNPLATFSARLDQSGSTKYVLTATTTVNNCEIIAAATMLSWAD